MSGWLQQKSYNLPSEMKGIFIMDQIKEEIIYEEKMDEITIQFGGIGLGCYDRCFRKNKKKKS